jgi:hypothetical protein
MGSGKGYFRAHAAWTVTEQYADAVCGRASRTTVRVYIEYSAARLLSFRKRHLRMSQRIED